MNFDNHQLSMQSARNRTWEEQNCWKEKKYQKRMDACTTHMGKNNRCCMAWEKIMNSEKVCWQKLTCIPATNLMPIVFLKISKTMWKFISQPPAFEMKFIYILKYLYDNEINALSFKIVYFWLRMAFPKFILFLCS